MQGKFNYAKTDNTAPKLRSGCDNTTALGLNENNNTSKEYQSSKLACIQITGMFWQRTLTAMNALSG